MLYIFSVNMKRNIKCKVKPGLYFFVVTELKI